MQPGTLVINFTDLCNLRCPWCSKRQVMTRGVRLWSDEVRERLFDHMRRTPYNVYGILGGEPTLFPEEIDRVLTFIRTECPSDAHVDLCTNGTRLTPGLVALVNDLNVHVTIAVQADGPKGLGVMLDHAPVPAAHMETLRKLDSLNIRCVALRRTSFATEAVTMHGLFSNARVETIFDITTLRDWTEEDIRHVDKELTLLRRLAPDHQDWHSLNMSTLQRCDCRRITSYSPDGQFTTNTYDIKGRTRIYGCAFMAEQLGEALFNRFLAVTQTCYPRQEAILPCPHMKIA